MKLLLIILHVFFVTFTDKPDHSEPALSMRAIEQRDKWKIEIDDLDYPVGKLYIDSLLKSGVTKIYHTSRWFNGATCEMTDETAQTIKALGFVADVEKTRDSNSPQYLMHKHLPSKNMPAEPELYTDGQLRLYNLLPLHDAGFKGKGILMTICDGGFYKADNMSCFRQTQELGHFDFTDDKDDFYGATGVHGTECLSTISGIIEYDYYGAATEANYYLMRSEESNTESPKEMDNLIAALEKSDSLGVNIFSVSLGYAMFDNSAWTLPKSALDGKTTRCSRAATIAARKGMLVCVAAGNEGDGNWRTIDVPADADSILTVGAVGRDSILATFSSRGPAKPDRK